MPDLLSADGTRIACERDGSGPPLVFVDGAFCHRSFGPGAAIARRLRDRFTVIRYDRRGRGASAAGTPWSVDRECEDLTAVIEANGGRAHVLGVSSGAALALEAALRNAPIERLVVFEPPFVIDDTKAPLPPDFVDGLRRAVAGGRRPDAVKAFLKLVGAPAFAVAIMRLLPVWKNLCAVAHTLPWDLSLVAPHHRGQPFATGAFDGIRAPTLVLWGGKSPAYMRNSGRALAAAVPGARGEELPKQTHMVKPGVLAGAVIRFCS